MNDELLNFFQEYGGGILIGMSTVLLIQYAISFLKKIRKKIKDLFANKDKIHAKKCFDNGKLSFQNREYDTAISHFKEAMNYGFYNNDCLYYLGRIHLNTQEYYKAVSKFEAVLDQNPQHADCHFYSSLAKRIIGDYDNAKKHFVDYFNNTTSTNKLVNIVSYYETAFEHLESNKFIDAIHHFNKARRYIMEPQ